MCHGDLDRRNDKEKKRAVGEQDQAHVRLTAILLWQLREQGGLHGGLPPSHEDLEHHHGPAEDDALEDKEDNVAQISRPGPPPAVPDSFDRVEAVPPAGRVQLLPVCEERRAHERVEDVPMPRLPVPVRLPVSANRESSEDVQEEEGWERRGEGRREPGRVERGGALKRQPGFPHVDLRPVCEEVVDLGGKLRSVIRGSISRLLRVALIDMLK